MKAAISAGAPLPDRASTWLRTSRSCPPACSRAFAVARHLGFYRCVFYLVLGNVQLAMQALHAADADAARNADA